MTFKLVCIIEEFELQLPFSASFIKNKNWVRLKCLAFRDHRLIWESISTMDFYSVVHLNFCNVTFWVSLFSFFNQYMLGLWSLLFNFNLRTRHRCLYARISRCSVFDARWMFNAQKLACDPRTILVQGLPLLSPSMNDFFNNFYFF